MKAKEEQQKQQEPQARPSSGNIQQTLTSGSAGMVQLSPRGRRESYPDYFNRIMTTYGARKENGYWIMDEDTFRKIKGMRAANLGRNSFLISSFEEFKIAVVAR